MLDIKYKDAIAKAAFLKELGVDRVYLDADDEKPWAHITKVEAGSSYRLNVPVSVRFTAQEAGLSFSWSVDMEARDANGTGVSSFDRDALRVLVSKLGPIARSALSSMLQHEVLAKLTERTNEIRAALNKQADSEDCVRGIIAFVEAQA